MSKFGEKYYDYRLLDEDIDFGKYKAQRRTIRHLFPGASTELETLIINLAHEKACAVHHKCINLSRYHMRGAIKTLLDMGYIQLLQNHYHSPLSKGTARIYQRTPLFEDTFKFRLPKKLVIKEAALVRPMNHPAVMLRPNNVRTTTAVTPSLNCNNNSSLIKPINSKPNKPSLPATNITSLNTANLASQSGIALKRYESLARNTEITLANKRQVFKHVWLFRNQGRLFQRGSHNYQQLPPKERKQLLIDGEPTVELDYDSLHLNLLLNITRQPCCLDFYTTILRELGIEAYKNKRTAMKLIMLVAINIETVGGFCSHSGKLAYKKGKRKGEKILPDLGVRPIEIYEAVIKKYPTLKQFIGTGKHAPSLQQIDSEIMIDVLETLAQRGVVALPVHDSVIVPLKHTDLAKQVMVDCYRNHTGFNIHVK